MNFRRDLTLKIASCIALMGGLAACDDGGVEAPPVDLARAQLAQGNGLAAEVLLRDALAQGASREDIAAYLGEAELQQGELAEAREWLGKDEFSQATRSHGFHMLGRLEMEEGNLPAAGQAFDRSLESEPDDAELWVDIGRLRYRGGEQVQAVEASVKALELDPASPVALQFRAQLVRDSEGMLAAVPWFERALDQNPENVDLLLDYAAILGELGRATEMLAVIREVAKLDPTNRRIYYLQAVLAARAEKFQLAQSLLLRSSKDDREKPAAMLLSGIIDIENGNYASAAQTLERLAAMQPDNRRVRQVLARALSLGDKNSEIIYRYEKLARQPSAAPYLQTLVARAFEAQDERAKAAEFLDLAAKGRTGRLVVMSSGTTLDVAEARGPKTGLDALALVRARIVAGNNAGAVAAAEAFLDKFPGSADALSLAGDANLAARRYARATERYNNAGAIRTPWLLARKQVKALLAADRRSEAIAELARHFVGDPANVEAAGLLAGIAAEQKDWDAAGIFADHAIRNGGRRDPLLLALRAEIALQSEELDLAAEMAETAYALQPMNRQVTATLYNVYTETAGDDDATQQLAAKIKKLRN